MYRTTFELEQELNAKAYEQQKDEIKRYNGQYVAIAKGEFLLVAATYDEAKAELKKLAPDAKHSLIFRAGEEPALKAIRE